MMDSRQYHKAFNDGQEGNLANTPELKKRGVPCGLLNEG